MVLHLGTLPEPFLIPQKLKCPAKPFSKSRDKSSAVMVSRLTYAGKSTSGLRTKGTVKHSYHQLSKMVSYQKFRDKLVSNIAKKVPYHRFRNKLFLNTVEKVPYQRFRKNFSTNATLKYFCPILAVLTTAAFISSNPFTPYSLFNPFAPSIPSVLFTAIIAFSS